MEKDQVRATTTVLYFYLDNEENKIPALVSSGTKSSIYSGLVNKKGIEQVAKQLPEEIHELYALLDGEVFKLQV
ncbi:hypothetical protein [Enterococcus mundtii]|uniref:Uncharacterized protein n=1 Tax=Enterococcus mundtii TaxID=53346 RepID=A0A1V2UI62_ENTMU|nr:hypothetical protein [Enterococcus mundtii]ONN42670.1 hypothetical protein BTN92_10405 [Enterococcus mundtii]